MVEKCKARGIRASAHGHGEYPTLAADAAKLAKSGKGPIIIIGHSLGADAAVYMANEMKTLGAPVALLVLFSPTTDLAIPSNVRQVVNYYQSNSAWRGKATKGAGFHGSIANINLDKAADVTHFNIESLDRLQNQAMGRITAHTGTGRPLPSATATASASPTTVTDASSSPARSKRSSRRAAASNRPIEAPSPHVASF